MKFLTSQVKLCLTSIIIVFSTEAFYAQNYLPDLDSSIVKPIKQAELCMESGDNSCLVLYDNSIGAAEKFSDTILAKTYKEVIFSLFNFGTPEYCRKYIYQALDQVDPSKFPAITSIYYRRLGMTYMRSEVFDSVYPYLDKSLELALHSTDSLQIAISYLTKADAYHLQGKTKLGLETLTDALPYAEKGNDFTRIGRVFIMGSIYLSNKDYKLARDKFREAMIAAGQGNRNIYFMAMINWAVAMNELGQPGPVSDSLPGAVAHFKGSFQEHPAKAQLANALFLQGKYMQSLELALEELSMRPSIDYQFITLNRKIAAKNYIALNQADQALEYSRLALENELERKDLDEELVEAYRIQAEALLLNEKVEKAYEVLKKSTELNDSLFSISKQKEILNLQEYYETEMRESKIVLQEKNISLLEEKSKVDNLQKILLAVGMFALAIITGLVLFISHQRIRKKENERKQQEEFYVQELAFKKKELTSQTLHLIQKSSFIQELHDNIQEVKNNSDQFQKEIKRIELVLKKEAASDKYWEVFKSYFKEVHNDFDKKLKVRNKLLSEQEIRLASFLRMNLTTKEIASLLNVVPDSVLKSKYRLKKKLQLEKDQDLMDYLHKL